MKRKHQEKRLFLSSVIICSYSIVSFVRPVLFNTLEYLSKKLKLSISDQLSEFPIHLEVYCGQKCKLWPFECA